MRAMVSDRYGGAGRHALDGSAGPPNRKKVKY